MPRSAPDTGSFPATPPTPVALPEVVRADADDALLTFTTETAKAPRAPHRQRISYRHLAGGSALVALIAVAAVAVVYYEPSPVEIVAAAPAVVTGSVRIHSQPEGAAVVIDNELRGTTPLQLQLAAGSHQLEVRGASGTRAFPLVVEAAAASTHYIDLAPAVAGTTGRLEVTSDPPGSEVRVDGAPSGRTPVILQAVAVGDHRVTIQRGETTIARTVRVNAGATASVFASAVPEGTAAGWLSIQSPFELQIFEDGRLLGTTSADRLMLPAGRHVLELSNEALEFRQGVAVQVGSGKTATATVTVPNGTLSINALPWAEVSVDGRAAGTTPLGNLSVAVGSHEIVWRHPQFGERRRTVAVTARTPVRIGVDFRQ